MEIKCATSFDERFDPADVLDDSNPSKFWMTTGLYPQELMFELKQPKSINQISCRVSGGKLTDFDFSFFATFL